MYTQITECRICQNKNLVTVVHLGDHALTGVFPASKDEKISVGPLELVKCYPSSPADNVCGLLQLNHNFSLSEMYGLNYGYRSSLNSSMVDHLANKVKKICSRIDLNAGDIIIDIGSNDCTLLKSYPDKSLVLSGIDPTGHKFKEYYPAHIGLIVDFFSAAAFRQKFGDKKAKVITSIAMFYDLESPMDFIRDIHSILDDNGIWVFEQSYMPFMLDKISYDTICHEHLEFYCLHQIKWMFDKIGMKILDVEFNDINGGSFSITAAKQEAKFPEATELVNSILSKEKLRGLDTLEPYEKFRQQIEEQKHALLAFIEKAKSENKRILGYGASTKGNVLLQYCGITENQIPFIAEVNADKFGKYTPETYIPIISEKEARAMKPDYFLVLPWHFKENFIVREADFINSGGSLVFPLPEIEIISNEFHRS
jgi:hypothetical protein